MTWNLVGQYLDVVLSFMLIARLFHLGLSAKYKAFLVFLAYDSLQSVIYIADRYLQDQGYNLVDYRVLWCSLRLVAWATTIWMVYALLIFILQQLPGILRFSLRLLNIIFAVSATIALLTIKPEFAASVSSGSPDWRVRTMVLALVLERAFSFAELLAILSILTFVLFFPIRVPRNLAAFAAGLSIYLCLSIGTILTADYLPGFYKLLTTDPLPFVMAACLLYWIFGISIAGESARATLGRGWQSVPRGNLVQQLEAMNAALLRSREQA